MSRMGEEEDEEAGFWRTLRHREWVRVSCSSRRSTGPSQAERRAQKDKFILIANP